MAIILSIIIIILNDVFYTIARDGERTYFIMPREKDGLNLAENIEIGSFFLEQPAKKLYHHIAV